MVCVYNKGTELLRQWSLVWSEKASGRRWASRDHMELSRSRLVK